MNLIAAVDSNNGIGIDGNLLYRIPEDLRYFKQMTYGKVVVMGHSTLKAMPGGRPLPGRINIVLTRTPGLKIEGCTVCASLAELWQAISAYNTEDVFVIGGEAVYTQLMDYCARAYITKIHGRKPADRFFPRLEGAPGWVLVSASEEKEHQGLRFTFCVYENRAVKPMA